MGSIPEKEPMELGAAPLNFIYACSLCSASFADVYDDHNETVRGLSDGINPKERLVTRLFLANCCHVFCSSHLEGGGPPFHSEKERPKAPCPVCIKEKGDNKPQFLYSIRGFNKNEYDPLIPPSWFTAPPIRLDGSGKDMDALRFQYIALIRYCQNTYAIRKPLEQALKKSEKKLADMNDLVSKEREKVIRLQQDKEQFQVQKDRFEAMRAEVQRLQGLEQEFEQFRNLNINTRDLKTFITNKSAIRHYLKLVPMLMEQNEKMQKRLAQLGFAMPLEPVPNFKGVDPSAFDSDEALSEDDNGDSAGVLRKTTSSHTIGRYARTPSRIGTKPPSPYIQRPVKRQRLDSPLPRDIEIDRFSGQPPLPPPIKPMTRMQSVRKMFPSLRKKFSSDRSSPLVEESPGEIHMYDNASWQKAKTTRQQAHNGVHSEPPYMSGALPKEQPFQNSELRSPRLLDSIGRPKYQSGFTFQAPSPVRMDTRRNKHHFVRLPIEPSYIRLMDGLSCESEVELKLKDPRDNLGSSYEGDGRNRQAGHMYEKQAAQQSASRQDYWSLRNPPMHQYPYESSTSVGIYQRPPRSGQTNLSPNRTYNRPNLGRATPSPRKYQHTNNPIENVVSPFFRNSHSRAQICSPPGLAEPEDSSNRSAVYRSQRPRTAKPQATWPEPRSLNGLSFFDSPVSPSKEPRRLTQSYSQVDVEPVLSSRHHQTHNANSSGFIRRPETEFPQYSKHSAYVSSQNRASYVRQPIGYLHTVPNSSSNNHTIYNRNEKAISSVPSVLSNRSSVRSQPQWKSLQRAGVRSSRNTFSGFAGYRLGASSKDLFPVSGRRNVLR